MKSIWTENRIVTIMCRVVELNWVIVEYCRSIFLLVVRSWSLTNPNQLSPKPYKFSLFPKLKCWLSSPTISKLVIFQYNTSNYISNLFITKNKIFYLKFKSYLFILKVFIRLINLNKPVGQLYNYYEVLSALIPIQNTRYKRNES